MVRKLNTQPATQRTNKLAISVKKVSIKALEFSFAVVTVAFGVTIQPQLISIINNYFLYVPGKENLNPSSPHEGPSNEGPAIAGGSSNEESSNEESSNEESSNEESSNEGSSNEESSNEESSNEESSNEGSSNEGPAIAGGSSNEGPAIAGGHPNEPHQQDVLGRDEALQLIRGWVDSWPSVYGSPGSEEGLTAVKTFVYSNSPYFNYVLNITNGIHNLKKNQAFYSYRNLKVEPVDYNQDVDGPIITVKLSGEYTYTEGLKVMGPKPLSPTTSYRFKQEEGDWKIYRSKSEDSSKWIDKINYR